jgi:hypothetical protein
LWRALARLVGAGALNEGMARAMRKAGYGNDVEEPVYAGAHRFPARVRVVYV